MKFLPTNALALHTKSSSLLSPLELEALAGTADAEQQVGWLCKQRISFLIGTDRLPKVLWQAVSTHMAPVSSKEPYREFLHEDELAALIDAKSRRLQAEWLNANGWHFARSAAGRLIVGRAYARSKLAGVQQDELQCSLGQSQDIAHLESIKEIAATDKLTERQMAAELGITPRALQGRRYRGQIPEGVWMKAGRTTYYSRLKYEQWLESVWPAGVEQKGAASSSRVKRKLRSQAPFPLLV